MKIFIFFFFFFSSRRRHTRSLRDWSSDVCSSDLDPLTLTTVQMLAGGATIMAVAAVRGELGGLAPAAVSAKSWLALAYLIVFGSLVAFTAYVWLLGRAPVSVVSTYAYVNPAVAVLLGALLASERLTAATLPGGLVILAAVAVVVTAEGRRQRRSRRAAAADE